MKVYTVGHPSNANWIYNCEHTNYKNSEIVLFIGGEDVNPKLYGEPAHKSTYYNLYRDEKEAEIYERCIADRKKIIGICRGFQFIHAMQGFQIAQDIDRHGGGHLVEKHNDCNIDFKPFATIGSHHQNPVIHNNAKIVPIAISRLGSKKYDGFDKLIPTDYEVEAAFYPSICALGVQYHPEWSNEGSESHIMTNLFIQKYVST